LEKCQPTNLEASNEAAQQIVVVVEEGQLDICY